ncbi:MAG: DUF4352 domain-containing protein [Actinomycetota bacterium]
MKVLLPLFMIAMLLMCGVLVTLIKLAPIEEIERVRRAAKNERSKIPTIEIKPFSEKGLKYGPSYKTHGLKITINSIRRATKNSGLIMSEYPTWLIVNLTIKNISDEPIEDPSMYLPMRIIDSEGNEFIGNGDLLSSERRVEMGEPLIFEEIDKLNPGVKDRLPPGEELTGNIWFSLPEESKGLKLIYDPGPFGKKLKWSLK